MCRVTLLLLLFVTASACGQSPWAKDDPPDGEISALQLPESLRGAWSPYSRNYQRFGDLILRSGFAQLGCVHAGSVSSSTGKGASVLPRVAGLFSMRRQRSRILPHSRADGHRAGGICLCETR